MGAVHTYRYIIVNDIEPADLASTLEDSSWQAIAYHASIGDLDGYFPGSYTKSITMSTDYGYPFNTNISCIKLDMNHDGNMNTVDFMIRKRIGRYMTSSMHGNKYTNTGYYNSVVRGFINGLIYNSLPSDLKQYIIPKTVMTAGSRSGSSSVIIPCKDYLWIPTQREVGGTKNTLDYQYHETYSMFTNASNRRLQDEDNQYINWWTSSPVETDQSKFYYIYTDGTIYYNDNNLNYYTVFGFRLGKKS